jgi:glutaredoxin
VKELVIFGRPGCHLCEEMAQLLEPLCRARGVRLRVADVDTQSAWQQRFGARVPVVCAGDLELSGYPPDTTRLIGWLDQPDG